MASTKTLKGGKVKFKKKDGTWSKRSYGSKSAAMAARRATRGGGGGRGAPANKGTSKPGWGRWAKVARTVDVVSGPAQGSFKGLGFTKEGMTDAANRYVGGDGHTEIKPFANMDTVKGTYGGIGTGLARDWGRSKLGIYRGVGQKKLLSMVMAGNPEILAFTEVSPTDDWWNWNVIRNINDRGYNPNDNSWSLGTSDYRGSRFWRSVGFDVVLRGIQHFIFDTTGPVGLNRFLPKGWNA